MTEISRKNLWEIIKNLLSDTGNILIGKVFYAVSQLVFIIALSKQHGPSAVGLYALAVAIMGPVAHLLSKDAPTNIIAGTLLSNNLGEVLKFPFFAMIVSQILVAYYYFKGSNPEVLIFSLILIIKICETIGEMEAALSQSRSDFIAVRKNLMIRAALVYFLGAVLVFFVGNLALVFIIMGLASIGTSFLFVKYLMIGGLHFEPLSRFGATFSEIKLGSAAALKSLSTGSLRYFCVAFWDVRTLGLMTPAFQFLTFLALVGVVFEKVLTPLILKSLSDGGYQARNSLTAYLIMIGLLYFIIIFASFFFHGEFFKLFFDEPHEDISILIFIFSLGWPLYIARSVLKVVSFYFGASGYQLKLQVVNFMILIFLLGISSTMLGYASVAISYVVTAAIASGIYLLLIIRSR